MKKLSFLLLSLLISSVVLGEVMELTDPNGKEIKAELIKVHSNGVDLKMNGQTFRDVAMNTFSAESQKKIEAWAKEQKLNNLEEFVSIRALDKTGSKTKTTESVLVTSGKVYEKGKEITIWPAFYKIVLENNGQETYRDLTVAYQIYKEADEMQYRKDDSPSLERIEGKHSIQALEPRQEYSFDSDPMEMKEERFLKGIRTTGEKDDETEDELYGIWIKVYMNKKVVLEYSEPRSLSEDENWDGDY